MKLTATPDGENAKGKPQMTLAELEKLVQRARINEMPDNALVSVRIGFGGGLREITVDDDKLRPVGEPRG